MLLAAMMLTRSRIAAALAAVGFTASIAFTPTTSSDAYDAYHGSKSPDIGARHGHATP